MKTIVTIAAAAAALSVPACGPTQPAVRFPSEADQILRAGAVREIAGFLADPNLGGRVVGTPGNLRAGEYLAGQFAAAGLVPGGDRGGWFQSAPVGCIRLPGPGCRLGVVGGQIFQLHRDFSPMAGGRSGRFAGPLVFAGYGGRDPNAGYDDYDGIDARGAVVLVLQGLPAGTGRDSVWWTQGPGFRARLLRAKLKLAAEAGASAVLVVSPPDVGPGGDVLCSVLGDAAGGLPAVRISRAVAAQLLARSGRQTSLSHLARTIRKTKRPASFGTNIQMSGQVELAEGRCRNVIGILPASRGQAAKVVLVGAHYDHLSACGAGAKDCGVGVRPGAEDNASGTAAMVLLARAVASLPQRRLTYIFVAFDGEEYGFNGSRHYVQHPVLPLKRMLVMINLDQIGRLRLNGLTVLGDTLREPFRTGLRVAARPYVGLRVRRWPFTSKRRWSDQAAFARGGVRTLFFFTGSHGQYHRMTDTIDKLDVGGVAAVARIVFRTLLHLERRAPT